MHVEPLVANEAPADTPAASEPEQALALVSEVVHVAPRQQTPLGRQGLGEHVVLVVAFEQKTASVRTHDVPWQQAIGDGQGEGVHVVEPGATYPAHWAGDETREHAPVEASQHAAGCGHGFGWHTPPAWKVLGAAHPGRALDVQAPDTGLQQAPGCGHGLGWQETPTPRKVRGPPSPVLVQELAVSVAHVPKMLWQQAPGCGQGVGLQVVLAP